VSTQYDIIPLQTAVIA